MTTRIRQPEKTERVEPAPAPFTAGVGLVAGGVVLLGFGTVLHPAHADPADAAMAFAEYAATSRPAWVGAHLLQLAGLAGITLAIVLLAGTLSDAANPWSRMTRACGTATLALVAVLQAVDGVALKIVVDGWSAAPAEERAGHFAAAVAVRAVEIGMDGIVALLLAATIAGLGAVHLTAPNGNRAIGIAAVVAAGVGASGGVLFCLRGFSPSAMDAAMGGLLLGVVAVAATALRARREAVTGVRP